MARNILLLGSAPCHNIANAMKPTFRTLVVAAIAVPALALACPFCQPKTTGVFIGETVEMGNGTLRSWVDIGEDKKPKELGVTFTDLAMEGLPFVEYNGMAKEHIVAPPKEAAAIPMDHISVDFMTEGHEPKPVYGVPHFDFHFYFVPRTQRSKMVINSDADKAVFDKPVPAGYMPEGYVLAPASHIPYMGSHWVDLKAPELSGQPFTHTLVYGSYDGRTIFIEPMITKAFFESKPDVVVPVKLPTKVAKSGLYPTEYCIRWNAARREITVSFRKFVHIQ